MKERIEKINDLMRDRVSMIIAKELSLKRNVFVSVSRVITSNDLRSSKVFVSVFPEKEQGYVMETLKKEKNKIQKIINKSLVMKILPRISFFYDGSQVRVDELEILFEKIKKEKEQRPN